MFDSLDKNHNGVLDARELKPLAKRFHISGPELLRLMDKNRDGGVDFPEFVRYMT